MAPLQCFHLHFPRKLDGFRPYKEVQVEPYMMVEKAPTMPKHRDLGTFRYKLILYDIPATKEKLQISLYIIKPTFSNLSRYRDGGCSRSLVTLIKGP